MKIFLIFVMGVMTLFARDGIVRDIINENTIMIEHNGKLQRAFLAGVASYLSSNAKNHEIGFKQREALREAAIDYLKERLRPGERIDFVKIDYEDDALHIFVIKKKDNSQLNYELVKEGYALLDCNDPYLLNGLYGRMKIAMNYAKSKKRGLWSQHGDTLEALIEKRTYYGSTNKNVKKEDVLEYLKNLSMAMGR